MKTLLKITALFLAVSLPFALAAEIAGLPIPLAADPFHLLGAFAVVLVLLTALQDYEPAKRGRALRAGLHSPANGRATNPLAA